MSNPRQVARLKNVQISESFVDEAVRRAGGRRISEVVTSIPNGIQNCDYLLGNFLMELKIIEREPLENLKRQEKLTSQFDELEKLGKAVAKSPKEIHLAGESSQRYWQLIGAPVGRDLRDAARQIRATKGLLNQPNLRGAVFLINCGGDSIDPDSFWKLAIRHRRDFSADINAVMCFSAIPAIAVGLNRPCVAFHHEHTGDGVDEAFVNLFKESFRSVFAETIGKKPDEIDGDDAAVQPLRAPFQMDTPNGNILIM